MQNQMNFLELLGITADVLQVLNYKENIIQTSNDKILKELYKQNTVYLERILEELKTLKSEK